MTKPRKAPAPNATGPDRIPKRNRLGWYVNPLTGERLRSVTTILNQGAPKPALPNWSANLTAETAIANLPYLVKSMLRPDERQAAYDWLRKAHLRKKDERAELGSAVHDIVEAKILGAPVPPSVLADPELRPFLLSFEAFVRDFEMTFEASEMVVANSEHGYAGTLDWLGRSPHLFGGALLMGDTKTGGELDVKGVYPEAAMQEAAYRAAKTAWLRDGTEVPFPEVHTTGIVLHLRPEGYRVYPVDCGPEVFAKFLNVYGVAEWTRVLSKSVVGEAIAPPAVPKEAAA